MTRDERVVLDGYRAICPAAEETGGAVVMRFPEAPGSSMLNRAVGLGVDRPATEDDVAAVIAAMGAGITYYIAVAPSAQPPELPTWLEEHGLERGWGWMAFRRGVDDLPRAATDLRLEEVRETDQARAFAEVVCAGFELPDELVPTIARAPGAGWLCWLALDGDEPASAAAMYVSEGAAYLGFGATLPEFRGRGAQNALLAERVRRAGELGCDTVLTETGERRDGLPSNSYRNILRAGFEEVAVTANWLGRS